MLHEIDVASDIPSSARLIAEYKEDIFSILSNNIAEGDDDRNDLNTLKTKLEEKKQKFEHELGKGVKEDGSVLPEKLDFTSNNAFDRMWKGYVNASWLP
jgi:hypothetical protein